MTSHSLWDQAVAAQEAGCVPQALELYEAILGENPGDTAAAHARAGSLLNLGRVQSSFEAYAALLSRNPGDAAAWLGMAEVMRHAGKHEGALTALDHALHHGADPERANVLKGISLHQLGRYEDAEAAYQKALAEAPSSRGAWSGMESLLLATGHPEKALAISRQTVDANANDPAAWTNLGVVYTALGEFAAERSAYLKALELAPDFAEAQFYLATLDLLSGDYQAGLPRMEWRKRTAQKSGFRAYSQPEWLGDQPIAGRRILVHAEQGLGDDIQFCRFLPVLADLGAQVVFACKDPLMALMRTLDPRIEVVPLNAEAAFDLHTALMSLPLALGARSALPPSNLPYLFADQQKIRAWRARLDSPGLKIGVSWKGSRRGVDRGNAATLRDLAPLTSFPNIQWVSLQKDAADEINRAHLPIENLGSDFDSGPDAFLDSAAVMMSLDLIITLDSAIAHLAGALGRPVWTFLPNVPDWRWGLEGSTTPWHPTMTLFRQTRRGDWSGPVSQMKAALAALSAERMETRR